MRTYLKWTAGAAVVGLGAALAGMALAAPDDPADRYRLATASVGDVAQTVPTSGTVDFVNRADVSFAIGGTLAELTVARGDRVTAGQELGTLDTADLRADVDAAESEVASAKATLEADEQSQQEAVDESTEDSSDKDAGPSDRLAAGQRAVKEAQTAAGKAIAAAKAALATQTSACTETPPTGADPDRAAPNAAASDAKAPPADSAAEDTACADALAAAMAAQDAVARAQDTLQQRIGELTATLAAESASEPEQPQEPEESEGPDRGGDTTPTAATIAADQAAVDRAEAELLTAEQALARATLTAPVAGTVADVRAAPGDDVGADTAVLVVIGEGAAVVETTVPVERIAEIEVGQPVTVTPTGSPTGVAGTVTRIGRLADDSTDTVSYPVTITVEEPPAAMPAGSTAGAAIVIDTAEDVLTVPTSAVRGGMVTVLDGTETSPRQVTVGAVGPLRMEITDGLAEGERVVIADLDSPLPSTDQQTGPGGDERMGVTSRPGGGPPVMRKGP